MILQMVAEEKVTLRRPNYSPRDFEIGGAAASVYDVFARAGLWVFANMIGHTRAIRPTSRNARVMVGGGFVSGVAAAVVALVVAVIAVVVFHEDDELIVGAPALAGALTTPIGVALAWTLIWYVERVRDEMLRGHWLQDVTGEDSRNGMEEAIDALPPIVRGRYYDEYFAARDRGQMPAEAHAVATRRCRRA